MNFIDYINDMIMTIFVYADENKNIFCYITKEEAPKYLRFLSKITAQITDLPLNSPNKHIEIGDVFYCNGVCSNGIPVSLIRIK